jgi:hypothetical protein
MSNASIVAHSIALPRVAETGRLAARRPGVALGDNASVLTRFVGVSRDRFVRSEMTIALDWQTELAADGGEFRKADISNSGQPSPRSQSPKARPSSGSSYSDPSLVLALRASLKSVQNGSCRFSR